MYNIEEIKRSEGLRLNAYKRKGDKWTIGYGSTYYKDNSLVKEGDVITREEAENLLRYKLEHEYIPQLKKLIKSNLNVQQWSALLSLIYNIGYGNLKQSDLLEYINQNPNDEHISFEWQRTCIRIGSRFERGLRLRRKREVKLYLSEAQ